MKDETEKRGWQWLVVWVLAAAALGFGLWGFQVYHAAAGKPRTLLDNLYYAFQLYIMQSGAVEGAVPWQLEVGRWLALAVGAYTVASILGVILREKITSFKLFMCRDHLVVCGLGRKGYLLARSLREDGKQVVVVERNGQNEHINRCRELGAIVVVGSAADPAVLRAAGVGRARWLVSLLPDDGENAEVAGQARSLAAARGGEGLSCFAHVAEPQLCDLLTERELATAAPGSFHLEFFNVYQLGALELLRSHPPFDGDGGGASPHLLVVGLGHMGRSVIAQAAREWHASGGAGRGKLDITFVDLEAEEKRKALLFSHPQVAAVCRLMPRALDVYSTAFQRGDFLAREQDEEEAAPVSAAYVCLDQDAAALYAALTLVRLLAGHGASVVVRLTHDAGLAKLLREGGAEEGVYGSLRPFKFYEQVCQKKLLSLGMTESVARAIHDEYVRGRVEKGETQRTNPSLIPWDELSAVLRASNYEQAKHINRKLRALGYDIERATDDGRAVVSFGDDEVERMAVMEHERWLEERADWTHGAKEAGALTHPHLVPWAELPEEVREIDREAVRRIPALLARVGYQVYRADGREQAAPEG